MKRLIVILSCTFLIIGFASPAVMSAGVSIGNADYTDGYDDLPKDVNDANDMAEVIRGGAGVQIDRNKTEMRADVAGTNGSGPPRVIFISSHGDSIPAAIVGVDTSKYYAGELAEDLNCGSNEGTLVILDACYSGGMADPAVAECCIFLTACSATECADAKLHPPRDARNSEFTEWVLKGVEGGADTPPNGNGDSETSLAELDSYLTANYDNVDHTHQLLGMEKPWADSFRPFRPVPELVPTLTEWGLILLVAMLILSAAFVLYRRRKTVVS